MTKCWFWWQITSPENSNSTGNYKTVGIGGEGYILQWCSCRFSPTFGLSRMTGIPYLFNSDFLPIPEVPEVADSEYSLQRE